MLSGSPSDEKPTGSVIVGVPELVDQLLHLNVMSKAADYAGQIAGCIRGG